VSRDWLLYLDDVPEILAAARVLLARFDRDDAQS
jgi:hypothetical protein